MKAQKTINRIVLVSAMISFFCGAAFGEASIPNTYKRHLITSRTDASNTVTLFSLLLDRDHHDVRGLLIENTEGKVRVATLEQIKSDEGAVLLTMSGYDVVRMMGKNVDSRHGGPFRLVFLYNGLTDSYRYSEFEIGYGSSGWEVSTTDQNGRRFFTTLFFKAHRWLGKVVGVERIYAPAP